MDRITENLLSEFVKEYDFGKLDKATQFEHFVNYSLISKDYSESFDPEDVYVGGNNQIGLDGLAIIVNGVLVNEEEEIEDLVKINNYLDIQYIFIQAKTSAKFDGTEIGSFINIVRDFFDKNPIFIHEQEVKKKIQLSNFILKLTSKMRENPKCSLYYVTTGKWTENPQLKARITQGKEDLEAISLFSSLYVQPLGASELQKVYRQSKETLTIEIEFSNKVTLPDIAGVEKAYIGILPTSVFLKLIVDESGNIRKTVFEDNIRDFQGNTHVNEGIRKTLLSDKPNSFVVLNNGVTLICRKLQSTGNRFVVSGYQIVNGCQTGHIIYELRKKINTEKVFLPVRIISTQDENIINNIIRATNSQNSVKPEELEAMTEFQKNLELFYRTYKGPGILYYERRSKQWVSKEIEKTRVVTIPSQIKAIASMFLDIPHKVSGYYGTVRNRIGDQIFKLDHECIPYYTSSLALYKLDTLYRNKAIEAQYKTLRWYLIMLLKYQITNQKSPPLSNRKIKEYCQPIIDTLVDTDKALKTYIEIIKIIEKNGIPEINKDSVKTEAFRDKILEPFIRN